MFMRNRFPYMMADAGAGGAGGGGAADEVEVDLPGGKIKLPKAAAEAVIKARDSFKEENRKTNERLGAIEAEKKNAEDAKRKAEDDKAMSEAAKAGEIDKVKQIAGQHVARLAERYRDRALEGSIGKVAGILPQAVADIAAQLRACCKFDVETDTLVVIDAAGRPVSGADGKPLQVDAWINSYLEARPWFREANKTPGSGATGGTDKQGVVPTITQAEYDAASRDPNRAQVIAKQIAAGTIKVA